MKRLAGMIALLVFISLACNRSARTGITPQPATQASIANTQNHTLSPLGAFFRDWIAGGAK